MEQLRVSIVADASGLAPGLASAQSQVEAAATSMAEAQAIATAATKSYTEAQTQLGAAAERGNAQAKAILSQYQAELAAAKTQVTQLAAAEQEQAVAAETLAGATTQAAVATAALGAAQGTTNAAMSHTVPQVAAASGALRELEGRMPLRAAERFLATTLGLGPALQAAFPIVGAIAMVGVLVEMGEKVHELYEKFIDISAVNDKLIEDFKKMRDTDIFNVHSIETATARLDEATRSAENLRAVAQDLHASSGKALLGDLLSGNLTGATVDLGSLVGAKKLADESGKQTEDAVKLSIIQLKQEHELTLAKIETAHAADGMLPKEQAITAEQQKRLAILKENQTFEQKEERALGNRSPRDAGSAMDAEKASQAAAEATVARYHDQLPLLREIDRLTIEAAHASDAELQPVEKITADLYKQLELNQLKADSTTSGTAAERASVLALENQLAVKKSQVALGEVADTAIERSFKEQIEQQDRLYKEGNEAEKRAAELFRQRREVQIAAARDEADATIRAAQDEYSAIQEQVRLEEQLGVISHRVAAQRLADASQQKTTAVTGALGKEQSIFDPAVSQREAQQYQQLQDKITAEARKGAQERERINDQEALKMAQTYKRVATEFNSEFTRAFNEWATKSQTSGQAFGRMLGDLELRGADFVAKTILQQAEMWLELKLLSLTGNATLLAQKQTSAAVQKLTDAKTAAANSYAWGSSWGGPPAGAISAAIAFVAVEAFEKGGVVGGYGPQMIQAHAGERVLSGPQTRNFDSLVNNGGSRSATLHQENHFGGGISKQMLEDHTARTMQQLRAMLRPEAFA